MSSSFAEEWPGRGPWARKGEARFSEEWTSLATAVAGAASVTFTATTAKPTGSSPAEADGMAGRVRRIWIGWRT